MKHVFCTVFLFLLFVYYSQAADTSGVLELKGHAEGFAQAAFSPDGKKLVTTGGDNIAKTWDAESGTELQKFEGHTGEINCALFSPDGKTIITASHDHTIRIWETESGKEVRKLEGHTDKVWSAAFSSDGTKIVSASDDGTARIWETESGKELKVFGAALIRGSMTGNAAFSPDGKKIVTSAGAAFENEGENALGGMSVGEVWDVESGEELTLLKGHLSCVYSAAFSPDGAKIVTSSADGSVRVWNADTGRRMKILKGNVSWSATFSPDGKKIAAAGGYGAVIWDAESGEQLQTLGEERPRFPAYSAAFSPDAKKVVTAHFDGTARIWDLERTQPQQPAITDF